MSKRPFLGVLIGMLPALSLADVAVPDTPVGHVLTAWLEAFNSGDRARKESFNKTYQWGSSLDSDMKWWAETRGYDLLEVYANDQTNIFFRVKARTNGVEEVGRLRVKEGEPVAIKELGAWRIPAGAKVDPVPLDATERARLVKSVADAYESSYVYPDTGRKMSAALQKSESRGDYRGVLYGQDLARTLTRDLREISHDKHVEVRFSYYARPEESSRKQSEMESRRLIAVNCGFEKVEHLAPNIGYVKFNVFADPKACAPTAGAAMTLVADSDALILDLRENRGGAPGMVEFIASYFFDERTHLDDIFNRVENTTTEAWTLPFVPGKKFLGKPLYVLTSKQTFSAAEALGYSLKNLKRATLVGETTLGGAHPTDTKRIDDHFSARVPYARSISPITGTNWEGTGVEPDVKVAADEALDVALELAAAH